MDDRTDIERLFLEDRIAPARAPTMAMGESCDALELQSIRAAGKQDTVWGAFWLFVGIVVTSASYGATAPGGTYIIATGAIGTGIVELVVGIHQWGRQ